MSDSHKIGVQLCLDVQSYAAELAAVGVEAAGLPEYASLQEVVRPQEEMIVGAPPPPAATTTESAN